MMIGDLPELGNLFGENDDEEEITSEHTHSEGSIELSERDIYIFLSKGDDKWISVNYLDIAPSGIGLHVMLPVQMKFTPDELKNMHIKFEKKVKNSIKTLKETPVMVRWQERDQVSGRMKLGIHFHGDVKSEAHIREILKTLQEQHS